MRRSQGTALAESSGDPTSRKQQHRTPRDFGLSFERREQIVTGEGEGVQRLIAKGHCSLTELHEARDSVPDLRFVCVEGR